MAQIDLWGDLPLEQVRTPVAIMKEQAALLGQKTQNTVEAVVVTSVEGELLRYSLRLVVPALDNYTYELLWIRHGVTMYPICSGWDTKLESEEAFTNWLHSQLASENTMRIVSALLAQANR